MGKNWMVSNIRLLNNANIDIFTKQKKIEFDNWRYYSSEGFQIQAGSYFDFKNATQSNYQVIIQNHSNPMMNKNEKYLFFDKNDLIKFGYYVNYNDQMWLITTVPELVGDVYYKAKMRLCNNTISYSIPSSKTIVGYDEWDRPIYSEGTPINIDIKCYVSQRHAGLLDDNEPIVLSQNKISILLPYPCENEIKRGFEFSMYGNNYKIIDINKTYLINNEGVIEIICEEIV